MSNPENKRLAVDLPLRMHDELKERCKERNTTITDQVFYLLLQWLENERKYDGDVTEMEKE